MLMKPDREDCIRAVAAFVMGLQDAGAKPEDIVAALEAAARCENSIREAGLTVTSSVG